MAISLVCAFLAAVSYGVGTVAQSVGVGRMTRPVPGDGTPYPLGRRLWEGRLYAVGLGLDAVGFIASIVALRGLPLFLVESAVASSVGVTAVVAFLVQGARLGRTAALALVVLLLGLVLLSVSAEPGAAHDVPAGLGWVLLSSSVLLGGVVAAAFASSAHFSGPVLAVASGLGFGVVGIAARVIVVVHPWWRMAGDPLLWALALAGVGSLVACGCALDRASATTVAALIVAAETVVPAAVGLAVLGDLVRPHLALLAGLGFVATLGGCLAVARSSLPVASVPRVP